MISHIDKNSLCYTPLFCEENAWKLIEHANYTAGIHPVHILFILNPDSTVCLFNQNRAEAGSPVIWDYHVILFAHYHDRPVIFDFDSRCSFPCPVDEYFRLTFPAQDQVAPDLRPMIRAYDAMDYFQRFSSDRSHMLGLISDNEFPDYPPIISTNGSPLWLNECRHTGNKLMNLQHPGDYLATIANH